MSVSISKIVPKNSLPLRLGGTLLSALAPLYTDTTPLAPTRPAAFVANGSEPLLAVEIRAEGVKGECRLTGGTKRLGQVFSGSATLGDQVTEIPVTLDRIPNRLAALSEFVTWELTEVATNRGLVSTQVMMELYFLLRDPGASFAKGIAIEALRDLARLPKQVDEWTPADQQRGPVPLTGYPVAQIVNNVFVYNPPRYDTVSGRAWYVDISNRNSITLHYHNYSNAHSDPNALCNCYDLATVIQYLINLYGPSNIITNWLYMNPFGYLRQTNLVGRDQCNNPFYANSYYSPKPIVSRTDPKRSAFANHAFCAVAYPVVIADACAGPHLGAETPENYVAAATDDVFPQPPSVRRGTVADITYYLGVGSVDMATEMTRTSEDRLPDEAAVNTFLKSIGLSALPAAAMPSGPPPARAWPDPAACPDLGPGWTVGFEELVPGSPESQKFWRLRNGPQTLTVTLYVASDGPATAERRFLILGSVHQIAGPVYQAGPRGLGTSAAALDTPGQARLFWLDGNAVVDLSWVGTPPGPDAGTRPDLERVARWFVASTRTAAPTARAPVSARASAPFVRVGEVVTIEMHAAPGAVVDVIQTPDGLQLVESDGPRLTFRGRRAGRYDVQLVAVDPDTLLGTPTTASVEVRNQ